MDHASNRTVVAKKTNIPLPNRWGQTPWTIDFHPETASIPERLDVAIIGAGFTGLAAAARLRQLDPSQQVAVFETGSIGAGSSGRTGGLALAETAAGDLPSLGDVLSGFSHILRDLEVACDLTLPGAWELHHGRPVAASPIRWEDSGTLSLSHRVPGGTVNPGKLVSGLARAAGRLGASVIENSEVICVRFAETPIVRLRDREIRARQVLFSTNAASLELSGLAEAAEPKFTMALATDALTDWQLRDLGVSSGNPFYTIDLPYLWGRLLNGNRIILGSGLVHLKDWRELATLDVACGESAQILRNLERRVHALHPALTNVTISHRWGGPILITDQWRPIFKRHPESSAAIVLGGYSGHGVALSVYLGSWAAEAMLGRRALPDW
jgi:glycine/D-amino acid oxidase-like deaminating enzyme